ncbi:helix-turn-helix domain-containing protein [Nonomuraea sp. B19D2]|uniref:helix-turn-helix domain-containing protein n=1 Tax=Nonomuraea sp. B19D2 TaxID=3159561 RepID=UPI0032D9C560
MLTLSEVARRAGLPKSTAYRVLGMLVRVGAVEREGTGYRIAFRMMAIGAGQVQLVEAATLAADQLDIDLRHEGAHHTESNSRSSRAASSASPPVRASVPA